MVHEIVNLHIGQAGIGMGNRIWDVLVGESGLDLHGNNNTDTLTKETQGCHRGSLFSEKYSGGYSPRACFLDTEPSVIDELFLINDYKHLFVDEYCVAGNDDAATCYARGKFHSGKLIHDGVMTALRRLLEDCDSPKAVAMYSSICGGTGSGYLAKLMPDVREKLPKQTFHAHSFIPSHNLTAHIVEPYNAVLSIAETTSSIDVQFVYDNESCYNIYEYVHEFSDIGTTYSHVNHLVAQVLSGISCCISFKHQLDCDINQFGTNLVPFPEINFISPSFVPMNHIYSKDNVCVQSITAESFLNNHEMTHLDPSVGEYIACGMIYRGENINMKKVYDAVKSVRTGFKVPFVDWVPTGFKIGISSSPTYHPYHKKHAEAIATPSVSLLKLTNHTGMFAVFDETLKKYDTMLQKRGYVWWYISEGMEEGEFIDSQEKLSASIEKMHITCSSNVDIDADDDDDAGD